LESVSFSKSLLLASPMRITRMLHKHKQYW
jgi:hypothetical protein